MITVKVVVLILCVLLAILFFIGIFLSDSLGMRVVCCFLAMFWLVGGIMSGIPPKYYDVTVHFVETDTYVEYDDVLIHRYRNTISLEKKDGTMVYLSNVEVSKKES